jgi:hypothetical protein
MICRQLKVVWIRSPTIGPNFPKHPLHWSPRGKPLMATDVFERASAPEQELRPLQRAGGVPVHNGDGSDNL